jgi:hypothetical protein
MTAAYVDVSIVRSQEREGGLQEIKLGVNSGMEEEVRIEGGSEDEQLWVEGGKRLVS